MFVLDLTRLRQRRLALVAALAALVLLARWGAAASQHDLARAAGTTAVPLRAIGTRQSVVALSFDVDWGESQPAAVLAVLRRQRAHATFFLAGPWARAHPDLVRAMLADGHEVESLGYRHIPLSRYPEVVVSEELARAGEALATITGRRPTYLRPPEGDVSQTLLADAAAQGYTVVLWALDSFDWMKPGVDYLVGRVARRASPGDIVRLHAGDGAPDTAAALPGILEGLEKRGLRLVTLSELVGLTAG